MNMLQLYESMLHVAGLVVNKDGAVSIKPLPGEKIKQPMTIKGKRLVIPTREQMTTPDWKKRIVFHPLSENVLKNESEALVRYRFAVNQNINIIIPSLMTYLLDIAASPDQHKKMTPKQTEYLVELSDVDEKTCENFRKLLSKIPVDDSNKSFVSIYMKRNGEVKGDRYPRVGVVTFPIYKALTDTTDNVIEGVKLRVKDVKALKALLEYILPGIDNPAEYFNSGSDSKIAPYTVSLMLAVAKVAACINNVVSTFFSTDSEEYANYTLRTDWIDLISDLTPIVNDIRMVPNQDAEEPESMTPKAEVKSEAVSGLPPLQSFNAPVAAQPTAAPAPAVAAPVAQPVTPAKPTGHVRETSIDAVLNRAYPGAQYQPPPPPVMQQPAMPYNGWGQPVQPMQAMQPYPQVNPWGQPVQQYPQVNQWGQPIMQGQVTGAYGYPVRNY